MSLSPNRLSFQRQRLFVPVTEFAGLLPGFTVTKGAILSSSELGLSADSATATVNNNTIAATLNLPNIVQMRSAVDTFATASELAEISTSGLVGLKMNTAGQKVSHLMPVPHEWDRYRPIDVKVAWTSGSSTAADTIDWIFTYLIHTANVAVALTASEGALSTVIASDNVTGALNLQETAAGVIAANRISTSPVTTVSSWMKFTIEMDAFAVGLSEDKYLLGVIFEYSPQYGKGLSDRRAKLPKFGQVS